MLAFSCIPNISGSSLNGSCSMYSLYSWIVSASGAKYMPDGEYLYASSRVFGEKKRFRTVRRQRWSQASVTLPPYVIWLCVCGVLCIHCGQS